MTLTSDDDQLVVGLSSGDIVVVCCVTGDVLSSVRRAHSAAVTGVVINSATSVLASGIHLLLDHRTAGAAAGFEKRYGPNWVPLYLF